MLSLGKGKYRNIIVSVALFLLLDASVLITNFYMSFQISEDAIAVNLAGRQRMLSQRIMKSLLETEVAQENLQARQSTLDELQRSLNLFENTLNAFVSGGTTTDANGFPIQLNTTENAKAESALQSASVLWQPFSTSIKALLNEGNRPNNPSFAIRLDSAIDYGSRYNLELLRLMNELTVALEEKASAKASRLRMIQTVGISLAILNFLLILFHFLRQLRESDKAIDLARQETQEILETVSEGLFLLDKDLIIGHQYSKQLTDIFQTDNIAGASFHDLLQALISEKDMSTAESFIKLLFKPTVNQKLIGELNPLNEIEVHFSDENGQYISKFLNFQFSRVSSHHSITHVLATVTDVTKQIRLSRELAHAQQQNEAQIEMLSTLMHANSDLMPMFIHNSFGCLEKINNILRLPSKSHVQHVAKVHQIYALIHGFKGEAASLGLTPFADMAHKFEDGLDALSHREQLSGNDFLSLTVQLNAMIRQLESAKKLIERLSSLSTSPVTNGEPKRQDWTHFQTFADEMAQRQQKKVDVICSGLNDYSLDAPLAEAINKICTQLIRNAVSHGIETIQERQASQKPEFGEINIHLCRLRNGHFRLTVQDDGQGINVEEIRLKAIENGLITEPQSELMDHKQLIALIFKPALSTASHASADAGRGMGMNVIHEQVKELGGKLNVLTRKNQGCTFTITLPASILIEHKAA